MSVPFYFKLKQPLRGVLAMIFTVAIAAIFYYVGTQKFWWEEAVKPISYVMLPNYLLLLFVWMFIYGNYFHFWPWGKLPQPVQGMATTLTIIVLSGVNFYILNNMAHWGAYLFYICSAWLFWIFMLGAWTDNPLATQYAAKQPLCGISGYVITFGMALLTWWVLPATFLGNATGVPFHLVHSRSLDCFLSSVVPGPDRTSVARLWHRRLVRGDFLHTGVDIQSQRESIPLPLPSRYRRD